MLIEAVAVAAEYRGYIQNSGVIQPLLYARHDRMFVVFGFDNGNRDIRLVVKDVIRSLAFATSGEVALYIDAAICEADFLACMSQPACSSAGVMNLVQMSRSDRSFLLVIPKPLARLMPCY
jgi:hypothetical protein|tara:strand:+ start:100 stop:462 length:363 start_codon:yes stop_codon:yes gene_type:complete